MHKKNDTAWYSFGDINAFFGLTLDNIACLVMIVGILVVQFGVPADFVLQRMVPGTAIGVLVGDALFFFISLWASKRSGRAFTAMPLGLDTPSIFGMSFFVLGRSYLHGKNDLGMDTYAAANYMWEIGMGTVFYCGLFKLICSFASNWARNSFPRAGLLGSLSAIALVIISFLPMLDILASPIVGMIALGIILTALIGKIAIPFRIPGVVAALVVAGGMHYLLQVFHLTEGAHATMDAGKSWMPTDWMLAFQLGWFERLGEAAEYLPVVLPLALATVIGGIDCTESAAAVGDHYSARQVIGVEAIATLVASFCGGVIQTTPYIGHPAYKAMGGRSAYTLATALFIGAAGVFGFFGYFFQWIPEAVVYPILIFVGLEITSQSFLATPQKHYPAVALACVPALAFLSMLFVGQIFGDESVRKATFESNQPASSQVASSSTSSSSSSSDRLPLTQENLMNPKLKSQLQIANMLKSGFVVTSLLWASSLAFSIDRRMFASAALMVLASCFTLFGIIHSPIPGESIYLPFTIPGSLSQWALPAPYRSLVYQWALGYALTGLLLGGWGLYLRQVDKTSDGAVKGEGI